MNLWAILGRPRTGKVGFVRRIAVQKSEGEKFHSIKPLITRFLMVFALLNLR